MAQEIPLTQGRVALVDDEDYERLALLHWHAELDCKTWYAIHSFRGDGKYHNIRMHRAVLGFGSGDPFIDHRNGDGLDNRRTNLRPSTCSQNNRNRRLGVTNATGFKGVQRNRYCARTKKPWLGMIKFEGKTDWLGPFETIEEAARAYDAKARELFGEFARLNFPLEGEADARA